MFFCQRPQTFLYLEKLINFIFPWKHGISIDDLSKDTSNGPHINLFIVWCSNKEFGSSIPPGGNIVGQWFFTIFIVNFSKTEITDLQLIVFTDEQVLRLNISVNNVHRVKVGNTFDQLINYSFY